MTPTSRSFAEPAGTGLPVRPGHPTRRPRPFPKAAFVTAVCVAAGFWLGVTYLPEPPTPTHAAAAYVEARAARDWPAAWNLMCRSMHADFDYRTFAKEAQQVADYYVLPTDVDVRTGDLDEVRVGGRSYFTVTVEVTSEKRNGNDYTFGGDLSLVREGGQFRVCLPKDGSTP